MSKQIQVTGCNDCPCCDVLDMHVGWGCCLKPKDDHGNYLRIESNRLYGPITPDWCPLKEQSITIKMNPA